MTIQNCMACVTALNINLFLGSLLRASHFVRHMEYLMRRHPFGLWMGAGITYWPIYLSTYAQLLIGSDRGSDIDREDENNPIIKYESCFPLVASLRKRASRLGFVFYFHIDGYTSFLRRRKLEPLVTSTYVTPFETMICKMRWKITKHPIWLK